MTRNGVKQISNIALFFISELYNVVAMKSSAHTRLVMYSIE